MKINYLSIPHSEQRYPTCGDYWLDEIGIWQFRVSELSDERYMMLVLIHELVEWTWCRWRKVPMEAIDLFDMEYEKNRKAGDTSEPGDSLDAPYYAAHQFATLVERMCAFFLGVVWDEYNKEVENL